MAGWVKLYDDKNFGDRCLTINEGHDIRDMKDVHSDNGKKGFNDKASSVKYNIPVMIVGIRDNGAKSPHSWMKGDYYVEQRSGQENSSQPG